MRGEFFRPRILEKKGCLGNVRAAVRANEKSAVFVFFFGAGFRFAELFAAFVMTFFLRRLIRPDFAFARFVCGGAVSSLAASTAFHVRVGSGSTFSFSYLRDFALRFSRRDFPRPGARLFVATLFFRRVSSACIVASTRALSARQSRDADALHLRLRGFRWI